MRAQYEIRARALDLALKYMERVIAEGEQQAFNFTSLETVADHFVDYIKARPKKERK
jgi:tryptophan 2,3-dioxygenase